MLVRVNVVFRPPTLAITSIAGQIGVSTNDIINSNKANAGVEITGTTSGVEDGRIVTITLADSSNHVVFIGTATVTSGTWSINLSPAEAKALADGIYTLTADTTNAAGDPAEASRAIRVDETPPTIAIHTIVGNDVVNVKAASTGFYDFDAAHYGYSPSGSSPLVAPVIPSDRPLAPTFVASPRGNEPKPRAAPVAPQPVTSPFAEGDLPMVGPLPKSNSSPPPPLLLPPPPPFFFCFVGVSPSSRSLSLDS